MLLCVTITVRVEKEVSADSIEAKEYLKKSQLESVGTVADPAAAEGPSSKAGEGTSSSPKSGTVGGLSTISGPGGLRTTSGTTGGLSSAKPSEGLGSVMKSSKSGGGLSSVLKSLGKKPKMSTLVSKIPLK